MKIFLTTTALAAICVLGNAQATTGSTDNTSAKGNNILQVRGGHGGGHGGGFGGHEGFGAGHEGFGGRGDVARNDAGRLHHDENRIRRNDAYGAYGNYGYGGYGGYVGEDVGYGYGSGGCYTMADGSVVCN